MRYTNPDPLDQHSWESRRISPDAIPFSISVSTHVRIIVTTRHLKLARKVILWARRKMV